LQVQQNSDEEQAQVSIPVAKREDTGKYAVTVSNPFGEDTGLVSVVVLGRAVYFFAVMDLCRVENTDAEKTQGTLI